LLIGLVTLHSVSRAVADEKVIAGWVERVELRAAKTTLKAKLDTGAATSSISAINVEKFEHDKKHWVRFDLVLGAGPDAATLHLERRRVRRVRIKDHDKESGSRPVVELDICFNARLYTVQFTLADRRQFLYPILLGRRFLRKTAVIDPSATFVTQPGCDAKPAAAPQS
jgi:hypothetical protein